MKVELRASGELVEQILDMGERRIVGVRYEPLEGGAEPTGWLVFEIEAPDAPEGTTGMLPTYQREADGTVRMTDPGWQS